VRKFSQILIFILLSAIMAERVAVFATAGETGWMAVETEQSEKAMDGEKEKDDFKDKISAEPSFGLFSHTLIRDLYFHPCPRGLQTYITMPELPPELF
jgi:hypothetical protein